METQTVTWARFGRPNGSELPDYIGESARYAIVKCDSHRDTRKPVALAFR